MATDADSCDGPAVVKTEDEVFEITDFTNASDWERFIAQIEGKISDWHLNGYVKLHSLTENELTSGEWENFTVNLSFTGVPFTMTLHRLKEKEDSEQFVEEANEDEDKIQLPQYIEDMMNISNDFPARAHCIARWYGLRCFLVLSIASSGGVTSESKCNLLSSSVAVALNNASCDVPFFIQIHENWRRIFEGHAVSGGMSTEFEMVHLKKCPPQYNNLSGLLHVFKNKIGMTSLLSGSCRVSARFTYCLNDWGPEGKWPTKSPDPEEVAAHFGTLLSGCLDDPITELQLAATWPSMTGDMIIDNDIHSDFKPLTAPHWAIRFCYADDVPCLLSSYLYEFMKVTDRIESMTDLLNVLHEPAPNRDLSQALNRITEPTTKSVIPIVPAKLAFGITKVVTDPQSIIRKSAYTLGRIVAVRERIPRETLRDIKTFLFSHCVNADGVEASRQVPSSTYTFSHKLKAAPIDSLTHHLAMCIIVVNLCHGGLSAVAQVWHLFVSELRSLLDSGTSLPGIENVNPDLNTCLLHQKLQMLNCCINRKKQREQSQNSHEFLPDVDSWNSFESASDADNTKNGKSNAAMVDSCDSGDCIEVISTEKPNNVEAISGDIKESDKIDGVAMSEASIDDVDKMSRMFSAHSDSDDEFFECESDITVGDVDDDIIMTGVEKEFQNDENFQENEDSCKKESNSFEEEVIDTTYSPEGRLKSCGSLRLLRYNQPLYIPITQDHAPVTEDHLEEQADVFSKLGDTKEGSKVRAKMQSASLLSDMESFKAANPGCTLEDFVRWYSPRDFEEGKLSERMAIPNNLWVTSWKSARPIPVPRQKRIFDDTKEAEKVLHFLTNLKPAEVAQLLIPICTHEALLVIKLASENMSESLPSLPLLCSQIETRASQLFRSWRMYGSVSNQFKGWTKDIRAKVEDLFRQISFAENLIERGRSLQHKFANLGSEFEVRMFVRKLLEHPEVQLDGAGEGKEGCIVRYFFQNQQNRTQAAQEMVESEPEQSQVPPLPDPTGREFILRATHAYPTVASRDLPHRLYAVLMRNEFRLAAAVSSDTTFF